MSRFKKLRNLLLFFKKIRAFLIYDLIITIVFWESVFLVGEVCPKRIWPCCNMGNVYCLAHPIVGELCRRAVICVMVSKT